MSTPKQFMDCIAPMPIVEALNPACWGAAAVGARDQGNGLEDRTMSDYSYWDGAVLKDPKSGRYYMFASRWEQKGGHWGNDDGPGWRGSQAVYAVSDSLFGPYADQGPLWPDWCEGAGHNVFPFLLSESDPLHADGYRYAVCVSDTGRHGETANGTFHIAKSLDGPWELPENGCGGRLNCDGAFLLSNVSVAVRPGGGYLALDRRGNIAAADSIAGVWRTRLEGLWATIPCMKDRVRYIEDGVIWHSGGLYRIVVNDWEARQAYYLTSPDGLSWTLHSGLAYTPKAGYIRYENGLVNRWTKVERPSVYIEDGRVTAMTFAVIDVQKEEDLGNDDHGSKVIVVPFDGEKLALLDGARESQAVSPERNGH